MAKGYRSRSRITLDLLLALEAPCNVSTLLRVANVSHPRLKEYLAELGRNGWAAEQPTGWQATAKGRMVRAELARVASEMADVGLEL